MSIPAAEMLTNETEDASERLLATIDLLQERIAEIEFSEEDKGWTKFGGDSGIEISRTYLDRIIARSRVFFLSNPLINRAVSLQADYVFAQGVTVQATNKQVNEVIQSFVDDPKNIRELTGHRAKILKEQTLMLDGNLFLVLFTDMAKTGEVQLRSILVDEIVDIITNPDDLNDVWMYKRVWTSRNQIDNVVEVRTAYYPDVAYTPAANNRIKTMRVNGVDVPILWDAPIVHIKVGELEKSKFGVPEVYAALDWAQAHKNFLQDWVTIVRAYARIAWNVRVAGGKNAVAATRNKLASTVTSADATERNPSPSVGSLFVAPKDGTTIEPVRTAGATTSAQDGRELRMMVASAMGIPDTMLSGDAATGNLATAKTLDRPTELRYRSRQQIWIDVFTQIYNHVLYWAIVAPQGPLRNKVQTKIDTKGKRIIIVNNKSFDTHIEVVFPPILEHSITDRISAVTEAVTLNGKAFAIDSPELAKLTIRLMFQALGLADVDELVDQVFAGISDEQLKQPQPQQQDVPPTNKPAE